MSGFLDFSALSISEGGGVSHPNGVFPGIVQSAQIVASGGGTPQVEIKVEPTEPEYAGAVRTTWINLAASDPSKADGLLQVWAACLLSVGLTIEQIKAAGKIPHEQIPGVLTGRPCFYEASDRLKGDGSYTQQINFLKPATYVIRRAAQDAAGGPTPFDASRQAPATAVAGLGAPLALPTAPLALPTPPVAAATAPVFAAPAAAPVFQAPAPAPAPVFQAPAPAAAPASAGLAALLGGR